MHAKGTTVPGRPPSSTRDELILALDLYLSCGRKVLDTNKAETIALAALLNRLDRDDQTGSSAPPRTPGSVKAKLANLRALDPTTSSTGFANGGRLDLDVWNEFADHPDQLRQAVAAIRARTQRSWPVDDTEPG